MENDKKFVQIGLRRKGRIVKNEQYSLEEFPNEILRERICPLMTLMPTNLISKLFMNFIRKGVDKHLIQAYRKGYSDCMKDLTIDMSTSIDQDSFGKKKK